jgi:hypothetical protein
MRGGPQPPPRNQWVEYLVRPLLIGVMCGCVAVSLVELVRVLFPRWNGTFLVAGCVLAALEANYSYRLIRAKSLRGTDWLRFRVVEILLFFPVLKLGSYLGDSLPGVVADIRSWPQYPERLFDTETLAAFLLAILAWRVATETVEDFDRLNDPPHFHRGEIPPFESLTGRFFSGGLILLLTSGLTRIGLAEVLNLSRPSVPGLIVNVLVYFVLGLVILGQVRYVTLRRRWQAQQITISPELAGRWLRYSLAFIGLVAALAFLLPTSYTLGLLQVVGWVVGLIAGIIAYVGVLLFYLITLPLAWLASLFGGQPMPAPSLPPPRQLPPIDQAGQPLPNWIQILKSLVFWGAVLGMLYYVVRSYVRDHPELLASLANLRLIRALSSLWQAVWSWLGGWGRTLAGHVPRGLARRLVRRGGPSERGFGFLRLRGLSPRAQVLYYYLSVLQRAAQQGLARRPAQTPDEYRATLGPSLPQVRQDVDELTDAFVEARYSRHPVVSDQAQRVRLSWQHIKLALRAIRHKKEGDASRTLSDKSR